MSTNVNVEGTRLKRNNQCFLDILKRQIGWNKKIAELIMLIE